MLELGLLMLWEIIHIDFAKLAMLSLSSSIIITGLTQLLLTKEGASLWKTVRKVQHQRYKTVIQRNLFTSFFYWEYPSRLRFYGVVMILLGVYILYKFY